MSLQYAYLPPPSQCNPLRTLHIFSLVLVNFLHHCPSTDMTVEWETGCHTLGRQRLVASMTASISDRLPTVLSAVLQSHQITPGEPFRLQCQLSIDALASATGHKTASIPVASFDIGHQLSPPLQGSQVGSIHQTNASSPPFSEPPVEQLIDKGASRPNTDHLPLTKTRKRGRSAIEAAEESTPARQTKKSRQQTLSTHNTAPQEVSLKSNDGALDKLITGVWQALFSDTKLDPSEFSINVQTIANSEELKLLAGSEIEEADITTGDSTVAARSLFSRVNLIARRVSQTSRFCRALEVSVQARWVQCFDDRVQVLSRSHTPEVAKKMTMGEACSDFGWSEKELRNKMCIWRGYQHIAKCGGYVTLIFAGPGLYRFCKYRLSFDDKTFAALHGLRAAFEVAADTLQPCWRRVLGFLGMSQERKYTGHLHDWVIRGPGNEPVPLATTYHQWDRNFSYRHIEGSVIDQDAWGDHDPRSTCRPGASEALSCEVCHARQSDDSTQNGCRCFPALYGHSHARLPPVQIIQTSSGKNNGLFACLPFEAGEAVGEFVGELTTGITGLDVMFGQTEDASYQIWQGRSGNYTRFVNHSCKPNAQYEHFNWRGTQRIVLVSQGIKASDEITVDYSDVYWKVSPSKILYVSCGRAARSY